MKIAIITPAFPYPKRSVLQGLERYVENLAINFKKTGFSVKIVTSFWNGGKRYDNYKGIPILRILDSKAIIGKFGSFLFLNYITFGLNLFRKRNFKFYQDSDILILIMAIKFTQFFKIKNLPVISIFFHYEYLRSLKDWVTLPIFHLLEKKQFKKHKNIITLSNSSKNDIIKYYKLEEKCIKVIPIGIDTKRFVPSNKSKEIIAKYGNNIILYSGLMVERKRVPILLEAMTYIIKELPNVHLILTGTGPLLDFYKKLATSLKIQKNTTFLGFIDDNKLLKYYASSAIFVFPSEKEGFGQALLEAMASGTPIICADKPPMSEIIGNGGITFIVNDSKDLTKKILYLLKNRRELNKFKENALKIAKKYEWEKIIEYYIEYINEIIKKQKFF